MRALVLAVCLSSAAFGQENSVSSPDEPFDPHWWVKLAEQHKLPSTGVAGTVSTPDGAASMNGPVHAWVFIDNKLKAGSGVTNAMMPLAHGCFHVTSELEPRQFGSDARGYAPVKVPIGKGYFLADVVLNPVGSPTPSTIALREISAREFALRADACMALSFPGKGKS